MLTNDYVGLEGTAEVFCVGHSHKLPVKVVSIAGDQLKVETPGEWCEMDPTMDDVAWVRPLDADDKPGESPLIGWTEDAAYEVHVDL